MAETTFEVKSYPEMWRSLGVDGERFEKMRCVLGDVYQKNFMLQENRPQGMEYFDWIISEIHGGRIAEILDRYVPTHVMEIPPMKRERDRRLWIEEVQDFTAKIESVSGKQVTTVNLKAAVKVMNDKRRASTG